MSDCRSTVALKTVFTRLEYMLNVLPALSSGDLPSLYKQRCPAESVESDCPALLGSIPPPTSDRAFLHRETP